MPLSVTGSMTSATPLACALCSVKFEDLDSLLQHMAGHTAPTTPAPAASAGQPSSMRQIVLSRTAFLRLKPLLQQSAARSTVTIVTQGAGRSSRPIRPRPVQSASPPDTGRLEVEVLEPSEPPEPARQVRPSQPADPDSIECCVCRRRFKHKYSLVAHCRQHIMSRLCGVCHERLPDGQALVNHLETHMEKNSTFKCDQCEKSFVHAKSLYVHKRNHSGVRPYTCQYCHKTFRHWHKHRVHVRIHTGERPYRCDVCGWGFPRNDECKRHMRTHVGQKAFHCVDCGVGCSTQVALMRHQELHHDKEISPAENEEQDSAEVAEEDAESEETEEAAADAAAETEADKYADLDDTITVKVEMEDDTGDDKSAEGDDTAGARTIGSDEVADDSAEGPDVADDDDDADDVDDPPYQPDSDSGSDISGAGERRDPPLASVTRSIDSPDAPTQRKDQDAAEEPDPLSDSVEQQPQRDPIAIDEPKHEGALEVSEPDAVIKTEPRDADEEPPAAEANPDPAPWDSDSNADLDDANVSLLEPEVNLTELFIDIERMRSTIRRKIAANAHKFDAAVTQKARCFVRDPEPSIDNMRSILRAKLEEGKQIQALLSRQEAVKRQKSPELEPPNKKIKIEPQDSDDFETGNSAAATAPSAILDSSAIKSEPFRGRSRRPPPAVWFPRRRGRPQTEAATGRTSDPSATPRVPRRRWIQHELNFPAGDDALGDLAPLQDVRISTGFGEL